MRELESWRTVQVSLREKSQIRRSVSVSTLVNWCLSLRSSGQLTVESGQLWYPLRGLFEIIAIIIIANLDYRV